MMRQLAGALVKAPWFRRAAVSTPGVRDLAWRFVAGEDLESGLAAARELAGRGLKATLNHVGTHLRSEAEAVAAADAIVEALARIQAEGLDVSFSLKLTRIGLDVDETLCRAQLRRVLQAARAANVFVRIDMEETAYTERTLALFEEMRAAHGELVGIALQSYLRRNEADLERLSEAGARIRLVKGGYLESGAGVLRSHAAMDQAFLRDIERLLKRGRQPAIATHDRGAIDRARELAASEGLGSGAFEFEMLYGVREDVQADLVRQGYAVRCYVPYGAQWWEYVLGCLRRAPGGAVRQSAERLRDGARLP